MAQANVEESASVQSAKSEKSRAKSSSARLSTKTHQMVQGSKSEPQDPQMGSGAAIFTDWASI